MNDSHSNTLRYIWSRSGLPCSRKIGPPRPKHSECKSLINLVSRLRSSFVEPCDLLEDRVCGRGPDKGLAVLVVVRQILLDREFQRAHVLESPAPNALRGQRREKPLDLIQSTRTRRREMQVIARMVDKPADDLRRCMRAVVVHDEVHLAVGWEFRIHLIEKFQKLLVAMPTMTLPDHFPGGDVERGKQRGRTVADIIRGSPSRALRSTRPGRWRHCPAPARPAGFLRPGRGAVARGSDIQGQVWLCRRSLESDPPA